MRTNVKLMLTLASTMLLSAPVAIAAPHDGDGGDRSGNHAVARRGDRDLSQLNLTDAQRATIKQIKAVENPQIASLREEARTQEQAFEALTPEQTGYQAAAANLAQTEANLTQARVIQRAHVYAQIYMILTPIQRAQLVQLKAAASDASRQGP